MPKFNTLFFVTLFALSLSSALGQIAPRIRYVASDGSPTAAGTSWATAITLQAALDNYRSGDILRLKVGSYTPGNQIDIRNITNRSLTFVLPEGISIYGGYTGEGSSIGGGETIIEGNIGSPSINTDNIKNLFTLTLRERGRVSLSRLTFARSYTSGSGGSISVSRDGLGSLNLSNVKFVGNRARNGGGISITRGEVFCEIVRCSFENNTASSRGGAIYASLLKRGWLNVIDSNFEGNTTSGSGGAIYVNGGFDIRNSTFERNASTSSSAGGGAIANENNANENRRSRIYFSTFEENTATNSGSAVYFTGSGEGVVIGCSFLNNSSSTFGTVYLHAGTNTSSILNNLFVGNNANSGSALRTSNTSTGNFMNNTAYNNTDRSTTDGSAVSLYNASWVVANNILYGNMGANELFLIGSGVTLAHNLIEDNDIGVLSGSTVPTRVSALTDPGSAEMVFASTMSTDANYLRLSPSSVAVDRGNNDYIDGTLGVLVLSSLDINNRILNGTVDVGAYELKRQKIIFHTTTPPNVSRVGGNVTLEVVAIEGNATGFTLPSSGTGAPASWLTVPSTLTDNNLVIAVKPNTNTSPRSDEIVFTPTGGSVTAIPTTVTITQQGASSPSSQTIRFTPTMPPAVSATGGNVTVGVVLGGGATGFTVPSSGTGAPASWLTVPATLRDGNLVIAVTANTRTTQRSDEIVFTPTGGSGTATPTTLTITQQGTSSPSSQTITFTPSTPPAVSAAGGNVTVGVMLGGDATGFTIPSSGMGTPASWLTVPATLTNGTLVIAVTANMSTSPRSDDIVFTPTGGLGTATPTTLTITQQRATSPSSQTIRFTPTMPPAVSAAMSNVTVGVMFGGGATGFTVPSSGTGAPASWLTVPATLRDGNLVIAVMANIGVQRSSDIVFTPTGGSGTAMATTLTITQQAGSAMNFGVLEGVFAEVRVVNPASDELVFYGLSMDVHCSLRDVSGREVFSSILLASAKQRISLPPLASGVYIATLESEEGEVYSVRLLRE